MSSLYGALNFNHDDDRYLQQFYSPYPPPTNYYPVPAHDIPHPPSNSLHYPAKRQRDDSADQTDHQSKQKNKLPACTRCKTLKVKCELKTDTDPCKRCIAAGKPCLTPGKRKRRTPPKREHLLNQIRDQAAQIQKLMSQLESSNKRKPAHRSSTSNSSEFELTSPVISPSSSAASSYIPDLAAAAAENTNSVNADVQDWLTKAKESIDAFGGFIGMGGGAVPKSFLLDEDPEDPVSSDDEYDYEEDVIVKSSVDGGDDDDNADDDVDDDDDNDIEFTVADSDGSEHIDDSNGQFNNLALASRGPRPRTLTSSSAGGATPSQRQKDLAGGGGGGMTDKPLAIYTKTSPFGLMAAMLNKKKHINRRSSDGGSDTAPDREVGVAGDDFFSPSTDQLADKPAPYILSHNIVTPKEVEKLFKIYFDYMNLSLSLLDPKLYTAKSTVYRSSFLFTVICAVASRYYTPRPELYNQLMPYAQQAAGTTLVTGKKNVEVCIAYILLSLYPVPKRRWDEDRSWIYLGLAIRVAVDINLHHPHTAKPQNEQHARELLNRTRIWLNCFNLDRSSGSQYGKPTVIKNTDYIANHSEGFWEATEYNVEHFDIHLCCYNAELRVISDFMGQIYSDPKHPTSLNKDLDFEQLATETDDKLVRLGEKWFAILDKTDMTDPQNFFRTGLLRLAYSYSRLVALSFGFQHAFMKNHGDENPFFFRCLRAASDVVKTYVDDLGRPTQRIYLRHGPEAQSVFVTFAAAFLVKLLQPKFAVFLTTEGRLEIRTLVQKTIDLIGSPDIAIDNRHGPKLYARFLEGLLAMPMARADHSPGGLRATHALPNKRSARRSKSSSGHTPELERYLEVPPPAAAATFVSKQTISSHASELFTTSPTSFSPPTLTANSMEMGTSTADVAAAAAADPKTSFPLPSKASYSFNHFAPTLAGSDPFAARATHETNLNMVMGMDVGVGLVGSMGGVNNNDSSPPFDYSSQNDMTMMNIDFMQPSLSLSLDHEIWQSMQSLAADWQDMSAFPSLGWMGDLQGSKNDDSMSFHLGHFPSPSPPR